MNKQEEFPSMLRGRLWHTTSPARYQMIMKDGFILPEPQVPDQERWAAYRGPEFHPYVRSLNGVSLFDFDSFNPESYDIRYPLSTWREFVPCRRKWGQAIWIEINRLLIFEDYISAKQLLARWKKGESYNHCIMPMIEAAHLGPIPLAVFSSVLKYDGDAELFEILPCPK